MTDRKSGERRRQTPVGRRQALHGRRRASARFRPACEAIEPRALMSTVPTVPFQLVNNSGIGTPSLNIANTQQPTFDGKVDPYSVVQLYAQNNSGAAPRFLGQTEAGLDGTWSLTAGPLLDGVYTVYVTEINPTAPASSTGATATASTVNSFPSSPIYLQNGPLVVDTTGPRVAALSFSPANRAITVLFQDAGVGLDPASVANPNNYILVKPNHIGIALTPVSNPPTPGVTGFYTSAESEELVIPAGVPLPPGRYTLGILSGGIRDLAGNALDGEYSGTLPSGNGQPGGNFVVNLIVPKTRVVHPRLPVHTIRHPLDKPPR